MEQTKYGPIIRYQKTRKILKNLVPEMPGYGNNTQTNSQKECGLLRYKSTLKSARLDMPSVYFYTSIMAYLHTTLTIKIIKKRTELRLIY